MIATAHTLRLTATIHTVVVLSLTAILAMTGCSEGPTSSPVTTTTDVTVTSPSTTPGADPPDETPTTATSLDEMTTITTQPNTAWTPPEVCATNQCDPYEVIAVLPVVFAGRDSDLGGRGVTYFRHDEPLWGPAAMIVDSAGMFWIADSAAIDGPRLIRVDPVSGDFELVDIDGGRAVSMLDIAPTPEGIAMLNVDGKSVPSIEIIGTSGTVISHIPLPERQFGLSRGLSGLALTPNNQLIVELEGGTRTALIDATTGDYTSHRGYPTAEGIFAFEPRPQGASETVLHTPNTDIPILVPDVLGTLTVLGVNPDGSFVISVDNVLMGPSGKVGVEQELRWYDAAGELQGTAGVPLTLQEVPISHPMFLASDGYIYGLLARPEHVEIVRFNYQPEDQ